MNSTKRKQTKRTTKSDSTELQGAIAKIIDAYGRFVPQEIIRLIGKDSIVNVALGNNVEKTMTILFADIRDFTALSEEMTPQENFSFINTYLASMTPVIARHSGIIDKYMGDGIMALFPTNADDALCSAIDMLNELVSFNRGLIKSGRPPIRIGLGLNTGLMMLGIIGGEHRMDSTVISDAVNLASRIETMTKDYGTPLLISEHTYYSLEDASRYDVRFIDRVKVKGKAQCQSIYEVFNADPAALRQAKRATKDIFEEALAYYHFKEGPKAMALLSECLRQAPDDTAARVYHARCERFLATRIHESSGEIDLVLSWNPSLAVGHEVIDAQHRALFDHASHFVEAIRKSQDGSELHTIIRFLDEYVANHFETEERCMTDMSYPFLKLQIKQHRRFSKYFNDFKNEIERGFDEHRAFLLFRTQIMLIDWLVNHTEKLDGHFGRFLRRG